LEPEGQEVIARVGKYEICKAAFDKALFVYRRTPSIDYAIRGF
jgi:hypothetical protein